MFWTKRWLMPPEPLHTGGIMSFFGEVAALTVMSSSELPVPFTIDAARRL